MRRPAPALDSSRPDTLQQVAQDANGFYWEAHSLLHAAELIAEKIQDDEGITELQTLIKMASMKVSEMQNCFNPYIKSKAQASLNA